MFGFKSRFVIEELSEVGKAQELLDWGLDKNGEKLTLYFCQNIDLHPMEGILLVLYFSVFMETEICA